MDTQSSHTWSVVMARAIRTTREHFNDFIQPITITIVLGVITILVAFFEFPFKSIIGPLIVAFNIVVTLWLVVVKFNISQILLEGKKPALPEIYQSSLSKTPSVFVTYLLIGITAIATIFSVYIIWGMLLGLTLANIIPGDPAQYLASLQRTLMYNPLDGLVMIVPGLALMIILGILSFFSIILFLTRYLFAIIDASVSPKTIGALEIMSRCSKATAGKWRTYIPAILMTFILVTFAGEIVALGIGSIITGGQYPLLELSENIYYNILSLVISGILSPILYLVGTQLYLSLYSPYNETK